MATRSMSRTLSRGVSRGYRIAVSQKVPERSYSPMTAQQVQTKAWSNVGKAIRQAMDQQNER